MLSLYLSRAPFGFVSFVFFWFGKCVKCVLYRVMLCFWWDLSHHRKPHYDTEFQCCRLISLPFSFAVRSRFNLDHDYFFSLSGYIFPHIKHTIAHSYSCEEKNESSGALQEAKISPQLSGLTREKRRGKNDAKIKNKKKYIWKDMHQRNKTKLQTKTTTNEWKTRGNKEKCFIRRDVTLCGGYEWRR